MPERKIEDDLKRVEDLARLMDSAFRVPVIGVRIGLDGLLGLLPGVGDVASLLPAAYIILLARKMGVPNDVLARMIVNSGADAAIGSVPVLGDIFDFAFKSNRRNVDLLRRHLSEQHELQQVAAARAQQRLP